MLKVSHLSKLRSALLAAGLLSALSLGACSQRLKGMEQALTTPLLTRSRRGVLPTAPGLTLLRHARTVARRAERKVVALTAVEAVNDAPRQYLNRLSDLLFVLARVLNRANLDGLGGDDVYWQSERLKRAAD